MYALRQVISGGQTGADKTALVVARELGLETGGYAPRHYKTEIGSDWELRDRFGLQEMKTEDYKPRTRKNVSTSDITVWIGSIGSPGFRCTYRAAQDYRKPFYVNPLPWELADVLCKKNVVVLNVAGNRSSSNPHVKTMTRDTLERAIALARNRPEVQ